MRKIVEYIKKIKTLGVSYSKGHIRPIGPKTVAQTNDYIQTTYRLHTSFQGIRVHTIVNDTTILESRNVYAFD